MDAEHEETGLIPRILAGVANLGYRFPWMVLAVTALSCGLCLWYTGQHLTYETQRNDLHGKDKAGMEGGGQTGAVRAGNLARRSKDQLKAVTEMATALTSAPTKGTAFSPNPLSTTTPPR